MKMNTGSWKCERCTYKHTHHAPNCAMCFHPRITKKHMADFVQGVPIPTAGNVGPQKPAPRKGIAPENELQRKKAPKATAASANPYAKKVKDHQGKPAPAAKQANRGPVPGNTQQPRFNAYAKRIVPQSREAAATTRNHKSNQKNNQMPASAEEVGNSQMHNFERPKGPIQKTLTGTNVAASAPPILQPRGPSSSRQSFAGRVPYTPGPVPIALDKAGEWIFPIDEKYPKRNYQFEISQTAVLHNTLVTLPTGLGKTLVAAVVMYNFYRWFPTGKVVFMAPTLPLVNQQVKACHQIVRHNHDSIAVKIDSCPYTLLFMNTDGNSGSGYSCVDRED